MKRNQWIAVGVAVVVVGFFLFGNDVMNMFRQTKGNSASPTLSINTETRVIHEDRIVGTGAEAVIGSVLTVHYVGVLQNGQQFDNSLERGVPFQFRLGAGEVIRGWDEGLLGMRVGGRRIIVIPPEFAYGDQPRGVIPPNSTLFFEVELLRVE